jgi:hypothetical protein
MKISDMIECIKAAFKGGEIEGCSRKTPLWMLSARTAWSFPIQDHSVLSKMTLVEELYEMDTHRPWSRDLCHRAADRIEDLEDRVRILNYSLERERKANAVFHSRIKEEELRRRNSKC